MDHFQAESPSPVPVVPVVKRVSSGRKSHMDSPRAVPKKLSKLQPSTPVSPARAAEQSQQTLSTLSNMESPGTVPRKHSKLQPQTPVSVRNESSIVGKETEKTETAADLSVLNQKTMAIFSVLFIIEAFKIKYLFRLNFSAFLHLSFQF